MNQSVYFQKASLKSYLSLQFLVTVTLIIIGLFEGALSTLDLFLFSTPWISYSIFFVLFIFYPVALPVLSIFIVTTLTDLYLNDLAASQTFAVIVSLLIVKKLISFPEQRDFIEIWQSFIIAMGIMVLIQILSFMIIEWHLVNIQAIFFQFGITVLIYPFIHVIVTRLAHIFTQAATR